MRIGINAHLLGGHESGVELWIRQLIRALSELDRENEYVIYTHKGAMPIEHQPAWRVAFRVRHRPWFRASRILWEQLRLPVQLRRDRVDVFHAPGYVMPVRCELPTVLTVHDVIALKFPWLASRANVVHYKLLLPRSLEAARVVIASSETTKQDILTVAPIPEGKVRVVRPGYDPLFDRRPTQAELDRARHDHALPERYILFTGNLEPKKNLPVLFKTLANMKARGRTNLTLVVAGAKSWRKRAALAGIGKLRAGVDVRFCGYVPREQMPAIYTLAELFVFPSLYEGFGFPPLEAMACGTPVVCSTTPALRETVGHAAIQVPPRDAGGLETAICQALDDRALRESLIARGRERIKEFSWQTTARGVLDAYEAAAGSRA